MRIVSLGVALFVFTSLVGCKKPGAETITAADAAVSSDAAAATASVASAATPLNADKALEGHAWDAGKSPELKLTWAAYPPVGQGEQSARRLELVARIGEVVRRFPLGSVKGALLPSNQSVCGDKQVAYKKSAGEVAKITFYVGGANTFAVRRRSPGMLEVESLQASDGYCPTNDCDTRTPLVKIPIPDDARIVEALSDIEAAGKEAPFDCTRGASSSPRATVCKPPQVLAYDESSRPICGAPCKVDADCAAPQKCVMEAKTDEATLGMANAIRNELYICVAPKPARPASSAHVMPLRAK